MAGLLGFIVGIGIIAGTYFFWAWVGEKRRWKAETPLLASGITVGVFALLIIGALVLVTVQGT